MKGTAGVEEKGEEVQRAQQPQTPDKICLSINSWLVCFSIHICTPQSPPGWLREDGEVTSPFPADSARGRKEARGSLPRKMEMMSRSACSDAPRDVAKFLRLSSWKPHCSTLVSSATVPTSPSAADAILAPGAPKGPLSSVRPECGHSSGASPPIPARSPPTACALAADPPSGSRRSRLLVGPARGRGLTPQGRQRAGRNVCNAKVTPAQNELGAARGGGAWNRKLE